jgi:hypothetical protein
MRRRDQRKPPAAVNYRGNYFIDGGNLLGGTSDVFIAPWWALVKRQLNARRAGTMPRAGHVDRS